MLQYKKQVNNLKFLRGVINMIKKVLNKKDKYFTSLFLMGLANLSMIVTMLNVNTTCNFLSHQPKLPEKAKSLRKF